MKFVLEKHKFFPYIAWTLFVGFAFFTYALATQLTDLAEALDERTQHTVSAVENGV